MPNFPTYRGELPECLSPLKLRDYFLLAYWVFFRPTALKCYLYQADPELYRAGAGLKIFRTLSVPAYRNLYLLVPGVTVLLALLIGLPIALIFLSIKICPGKKCTKIVSACKMKKVKRYKTLARKHLRLSKAKIHSLIG